jgi:MoaA/NifB/PqqE/SkfB family radical SAM enzyme
MINVHHSAQLRQTEAQDARLDFLWIELTTQCNLECIHCYCNSGPTVVTKTSLSLAERMSLIDAAAKLGCKQVQFIGGEPTLSKDLSSLIAHTRLRGIDVEVFTNATHISDEFLQCLRDHNVSIATSFYCDDALIHDSITKSKGSHARTVANIQRIVGAGLKLRVGVIGMTQNKHRLSQTEAFLRALGVTQIGTDMMRNLGRAASRSMSDTESMRELCGHCGNGRLAITPDGIVYPCVMSRNWPVGSLLNESLDDSLRAPLLQAFRDALAEAKQRIHPVTQCFPEEDVTVPRCYPDDPCSPKNPCWPDKPPCSPDRPGCLPDHGPPPCTPTDKCMPDMSSGQAVNPRPGMI